MLLTSLEIVNNRTSMAGRKRKMLTSEEFQYYIFMRHMKRCVCRRETIECREPLDVLTHKLGLWKVGPNGKPSHTTFERVGFNGTSSVVRCMCLSSLSVYLVIVVCVSCHRCLCTSSSLAVYLVIIVCVPCNHCSCILSSLSVYLVIVVCIPCHHCLCTLS